MINHYQTLRIPFSASSESIKSAYRKLARELHPDLSGQTDSSAFQKTADAYATLSDSTSRARYDRELLEFIRRRGLVLCPRCGTSNQLPKIPHGKLPICGACQAELPYTDNDRQTLESTALREHAISLAADLGAEMLDVAGDFLHTQIQSLRGRFGIRRRG